MSWTDWLTQPCETREEKWRLPLLNPQLTLTIQVRQGQPILRETSSFCRVFVAMITEVTVAFQFYIYANYFGRRTWRYRDIIHFAKTTIFVVEAIQAWGSKVGILLSSHRGSLLDLWSLFSHLSSYNLCISDPLRAQRLFTLYSKLRRKIPLPLFLQEKRL